MNLRDLPAVDVILGIDFGSYRTGLAAIEVGSKARLIEKARVVANSDIYVERWEQTIQHTEKFITEFLMGRPVAIAIEQPNSFRNGASTRILTGGFGAMLYWIHINKMAGIEINTTHAKKIFCGIAGKGKEPTISRANELYGLDLKFHRDPKKSDDDVADAIQVAYTLRHHLIEEDEWFKERSKRDA